MSIRGWLDTLGQTFTVFDQQDSGCVSYGIHAGSGTRLFVKTSTTAAAATSMRRALELHRAVFHPAIIAPLESHTFPSGQLAIVYPWRDGQVLYPATARGWAIRRDPDGALARFRALPVATILAALDTILDAHVAVAAAGFVTVDLYDGCFLYDFDRHQMHLIDLDEYHPGSFVLDADRLPGSTRFMAPEQWRRGATNDERTTVYMLGRTLRLLLDSGDVEEGWRGTPAQLEVIATATDHLPASRFASVPELVHAWRSAGDHS